MSPDHSLAELVLSGGLRQSHHGTQEGTIVSMCLNAEVMLAQALPIESLEAEEETIKI